MNQSPGFPTVEFRSRQQLRDWLHESRSTTTMFWLVCCKKHAEERHVPYSDIVEELPCFGWIDGRTRRLDEDRTMLLAAPRKPGSTWSAANKKRVVRLIKQGLMKPAGQEKINEAKNDVSWEYLDDIENRVIPDDLAKALNKNRLAQRNFDAFNSSSKKVTLLRIKTAKLEPTRQEPIRETVRLAAKGVKAAHPEAKGQ